MLYVLARSRRKPRTCSIKKSIWTMAMPWAPGQYPCRPCMPCSCCGIDPLALAAYKTMRLFDLFVAAIARELVVTPMVICSGGPTLGPPPGWPGPTPYLPIR